MFLYFLYQKNNGGSSTKSPAYMLKGIFLDDERAETHASELIRDHSYYTAHIQAVYIPDEAIAMMFKASMEAFEPENPEDL